MPEKCPQCGAEYPSGGDCWDRFGLCMAKEFEDPDTWGAVHHLTVTCYMLQHNAYSRDMWLEARKMLAEFVQEGVTPATMRKRIRSRFDSAQRNWSVTKGAKLSEFGSIVWTRTIAGVRLDDAETYCSDIKLWAMSVLKDTQVLIQNLNIEP
jgi:hypothetical protein